MRDVILSHKVPAPARVGSVAPVDVIVPAGGTGMDPSQTSFFQVLNIPTKINKGTVEIVSDVHLVKAGEKVRPVHRLSGRSASACDHCSSPALSLQVGTSEATLLSKLKINPFSYGLAVQKARRPPCTLAFHLLWGASGTARLSESVERS